MNTKTPNLPLEELPFIRQMMALLLHLQKQKIQDPKLDKCDKDLIAQICEPRVYELQKSFDAHELQEQALHFLRETEGRDHIFNAMQDLDFWPLWENHFLQCVIIYGAIFELEGLDDFADKKRIAKMNNADKLKKQIEEFNECLDKIAEFDLHPFFEDMIRKEMTEGIEAEFGEDGKLTGIGYPFEDDDDAFTDFFAPEHFRKKMTGHDFVFFSQIFRILNAEFLETQQRAENGDFPDWFVSTFHRAARMKHLELCVACEFGRKSLSQAIGAFTPRPIKMRNVSLPM